MTGARTSAWFIGEGGLLVQCAAAFARAGHHIVGIASSEAAVRGWCDQNGVLSVAATPWVPGTLPGETFDYLFSIANLERLGAAALAAPRLLAINFHDGPLPRYAGVHAPVWALIGGERHYGVTWHEMTSALDAGPIVKQRLFDLGEGETSYSLAARCYEAGLESFIELVEELGHGRVRPVPQDLTRRTEFSRDTRPDACLVSWQLPAERIVRLVRALDFGPSTNRFGSVRLMTGAGPFLLTGADIVGLSSLADPGRIVEIKPEAVVIATATSGVAIRAVRRITGERVSIREFVAECAVGVGDLLTPAAEPWSQTVKELHTAAVRNEAFWVQRLAGVAAASVPLTAAGAQAPGAGARSRITMTLADWVVTALIPSEADRTTVLLSLLAIYLARVSGDAAGAISFSDVRLSALRQSAASLLSDHFPVEVSLNRGSFRDVVAEIGAQLEEAADRGTYFLDIFARYPALRERGGFGQAGGPTLVAAVDDPQQSVAPPGIALAIFLDSQSPHLVWDFDPAAIRPELIGQMQRQFQLVASALARDVDRPLDALPLLDEQEMNRVLVEWNATGRPYEDTACIHELFERQAERSPEATAVVFRDQSVTYAGLNHHANHLAAQLRTLGVGSEAVVGVFIDRSLELVVALLAILKAGGAYLPLDPSFPQQRLAWMIDNTGTQIILTRSGLARRLPGHTAQVITVDLATTDPAFIANVAGGAQPNQLAYVIFTSGSTGLPRGVMVQHGNVTNLFAGMDDHLQWRTPGSWLAVTSISFDISVLELFWTLTRGFKVVLQEELAKTLNVAPAAGPAASTRPMDFSLFYFSSDAREDGGNRYRLLLEGAKYADSHGFRAVWTPERHFHAFGGLYPNPAVTSAAVAAITSHVLIRAGSVVLPLHNPIRVAEEWAVVDNISQGRVELSFASGWHANDFALMPDNYHDRRAVMSAGIETVRRLWRGDSIAVVNGRGEPIDVRIFPAPMQKEAPVWVTATGNVDTFQFAGRLGAKLLTNLLGQKLDEVATKITAYRTAWKEAGHPGNGTVALMLHTFVGADLDIVRDTVRQPLIDYLKTSMDLVEQAHWQFPALVDPAKPEGRINHVDLTDDEANAMSEHAFERYFQTSGLFGTPEICLRMVERLKAADVDEIACLLDFGLASDVVLDGLRSLNEVRERSQPHADATDFSVAAQIERHAITHLQATPSLIRAILADPRGRDALRQLDQLLVGGEPLPRALAAELLPLLEGELLNLYGPTETTVWSAVARITDSADITIGRPIANTQIYIVDPQGRPAPIGVAGELLIGGYGVTRGYWRQPDLTAERFVANPSLPAANDVVYRTGDLASYRSDGRIEFLGRLDRQVKVRGHRIELEEIESVLGAHQRVEQSAVVVKPDAGGAPRLVAYVVARNTDRADATGDVGRWQSIWDETYRADPADSVDPTFDISGWRSSYTGELLPEAELREWAGHTANRILALEPRRILEIGCGTGMLLFRLAPHVDRYTAIDFSVPVVERLRQVVAARRLEHVVVKAVAADALSAEPDLGTHDVVVINSVVQYFPDVDYLIRVLEQAVAMVHPGGAVFVGDVRSLSLLEAFHTSVELARAPAALPTEELRRRIRERVEQDAELVIAPEFFDALRARVPAVTAVTTRLKRGRAQNEMTRFRYDVVLHVGTTGEQRPAATPASGLTIADIRSLRRGRAGALAIGDIVNPRVSGALAAVRMLASADCPDVSGQLRRRLASEPEGGIDPEDLFEAAGDEVTLTWAASHAPDRYDAIFPEPSPRQVALIGPAVETRPWQEYVHHSKADGAQLIQAWKQHLRLRLPAFMVPGLFVLLDAMPLTPNGKLDRRALPEPDRAHLEPAATDALPGSDLERMIAETWQDVLALDRIGSHDNFFDIGANSLVMIQAHAALREKIGRPISLVDLFRFPTVAALAGHLGNDSRESAALDASEKQARARIDARDRRQRSRSTAG